MKALILLNFIIPFVMILVAFLLKRHPVKNMNSQNGYNTPGSRKSQVHWDYAQSIAPNIFLCFGWLAAAVELVWCIVFLLVRISLITGLVLGNLAGMGFLVAAFINVEIKLKKI